MHGRDLCNLSIALIPLSVNKTGQLFVLSAPSGAGKTSLVRAVVERMPDVVASISHTTRPMRASETDGEDYFFTTVETFTEMVKRGDFLEYAKIFGNFYGTSLLSIQALLEQGLKVILEIDWQGAVQVRHRVKDSISIFVLPPSIIELENRLHGRGQDSEEVIAERMRDAKDEIRHYSEFDHVIVNDSFEDTLQEFTAFLRDPKGDQAPKRLHSLTTELLA